MQVLDQVTVRWTYPAGLVGGPGYNIFYGPNLSSKLDSLRVFYDSCKAYLPLGMSVQILGNGVKVQDSDGIQVGDWTVTAPAAVVGTATSGLVVPQTGVVVDWRTLGRNWRGHRIAGKSYLVPMAQIVYSSGGTIVQSVANAINTAADGWKNVGGASFGVWSRPVHARDANNKPTDEILHQGVWAQCTSTNVPIKVVTLRSRRD
jgi:hypothetical protein